MSIESTLWAWSLRDITPAEKLILLCIAKRIDMNGTWSLSVDTLARETCLPKTQITTTLAKLQRNELISFENGIVGI